MLPKVLDHYSDSLPFLADAGLGRRRRAGQAARFAFGAAIVAVLVFAPGGMGALVARLRSTTHRRCRLSTPKERTDMNERLARLLAIGLTLLLAVAVGACGKGDDGRAAAAASGEVKTGPGVTAKTISARCS